MAMKISSIMNACGTVTGGSGEALMEDLLLFSGF